MTPVSRDTPGMRGGFWEAGLGVSPVLSQCPGLGQEKQGNRRAGMERDGREVWGGAIRKVLRQTGE